MYQGLVRVVLVGVVEPDSGWLGNLGWMELMVTFSPVNGEHDVNRLGTSLLDVHDVGVGGLGGCSRFPDCRQDTI
jgi:hypothetical protein